MSKRNAIKRSKQSRPSLIETNPEAIKLLLDRVRVGAYLETASAEAGLELPIVRSWVRKGNSERLRRRRMDDLRDAEELDDLSRPRKVRREERENRKQRDIEDMKTRAALDMYVVFAQQYEHASAIGEHAMLGILNRAAMGGAVVSRTTRTDSHGNVSTTERFSEPSWNAAAWRLERRAPHRWGSKVEHRIVEDDAVAGTSRGESTARLARVVDADLAMHASSTRPSKDPDPDAPANLVDKEPT